LTTHLDELTTEEQIHLFALADREIFGSERWGRGLLEPSFMEHLSRVQQEVQKVLAHPRGRIILSGAGTSGRIAYDTACRAALPEPIREKVIGLIAGGAPAFFTARERVEDLPEVGVRDLEPYLNDTDPFVYIGITCGLSAAYVASQAHYCMEKEHGLTVVMGFNEVQDANPRVLEPFGRSFQDILEEFEHTERAVLLNPIIGPEPVTGSTRLKGGTATKMLLDLILEDIPVQEGIDTLREAQQLWHAEGQKLIPLIQSCAGSFGKGGGLVYLSGVEIAFLPFLDASECPPTFSAEDDQVRAFAPQDLSEVYPDLNLQGRCIQDLIEELKARDTLSDDTLVTMGDSPVFPELERFKIRHRIDTPEIDSFARTLAKPWQRILTELSMKWKLNTLTTCAFTAHGKVLGNRMIDLKISNLKLWDRAAGLVAETGGFDLDLAKQLLTEEITGGSDLRDMRVEDLISMASDRTGIVASAVRRAQSIRKEKRVP